MNEQGVPADRPVIYCIVPRDLARELHDVLRRSYLGEPGVRVVVERRDCDRRAAAERRTGAAIVGSERRRIRNEAGRRMGDRRVPCAAVDGPLLPRRARRHADRLVFVERLEPTEEHAEDIDTARLIARIQAGERDSFVDLYMRYFDRVYGYLRVAFRHADDAEEGTQQVFAQVLEALPRYERRGGRPFRAWLFTIVRNYAVTQVKKEGRVDPVDPVAMSEMEEGPAPLEADLSALDWVSDPDLLIFIERLPLVQRQVLVLRFMLGMTAREVAGVLDMSPNHVSVHQYRALEFLRLRLTALGREPRSGRSAPMKARFKQAPVLRWRRFALTP